MPNLMRWALGALCVEVFVWVLVLLLRFFIEPRCSAVSLTSQYPCHLLSQRCSAASEINRPRVLLNCYRKVRSRQPMNYRGIAASQGRSKSSPKRCTRVAGLRDAEGASSFRFSAPSQPAIAGVESSLIKVNQGKSSQIKGVWGV